MRPSAAENRLPLRSSRFPAADTTQPQYEAICLNRLAHIYTVEWPNFMPRFTSSVRNKPNVRLRPMATRDEGPTGEFL